MFAKLPKLNELPFLSEIERSGGRIYLVGGAVRDYFLGIESKDLDILITGIPMDYLELILSAYGRVDAVGKSFGVLKFKFDFINEIDITIPRTERPNGKGGYQGFDVVSDHSLSIEKDLERRDFTINAIARDIEGNLIDPFNGVDDLKKGLIRMVNPQAFTDDPLRMLRAVQFASRFGFDIEKTTYESILNNAERIKEISAERILIELDKIVFKGNCFIGNKLLHDTLLLENIYRSDIYLPFTKESYWNKIKTRGEFIFSLLYQGNDRPSDFYKDVLKGDLDTYREIKALEMAILYQSNNVSQYRKYIFNIYKISASVLNSKILPDEIKCQIIDMKAKNMPFTNKDLKINGDDLINYGFVGKEIGDLIDEILNEIYSENLKNDRNDLIKYVELCQKKKQLI